jgi:predicted dienelactone hydrolase
MINKILRKEFNSKHYKFNDLIYAFKEFTLYEHRHRSAFNAKAIVELNEKYYPKLDKELYGFWETNQFVQNEDDKYLSEIYELNRVESAERTIIEKYWKLVNNE